MTPAQHHQRLARLSLIDEITAALEVEERIAQHRRRKIDWRRVLTTKTISEQTAITKGKS